MDPTGEDHEGHQPLLPGLGVDLGDGAPAVAEEEPGGLGSSDALDDGGAGVPQGAARTATGRRIVCEFET